MSVSSGSSLPADWAAVLDRVAEARVGAERAAAEREQALPPAGTSVPAPGGDVALRKVAEHLARLEAEVERAGRRLGPVETVLEDQERAVREWQQALRAVGERLANGVGGPV